MKKTETKITVDMLHKEHNLYPEQTQFHLSHNYDRKTKTWKFVGYRCTKCGVTFKRANTVPNHPSACRETYTNRKWDKDNELNIVRVDGKPWRPLDFNQEKPIG